MTERILDPSIRRSATEPWYVSERASQRDRYARCLRMLVPRLPQQSVVYDLGAGSGHFAGMLAAHAGQVVGVERIAERVALGRAANNRIANLRFVQGDVLDVDLGAGSVDGVCALEMLYYLAPGDWDRFFEAIFRALKPGGLLLTSLNVFSRDGGGEAALLGAVSRRFHVVDVQHMHRMFYYRIELPLIRLLDEINYLQQVKVFYPHSLAVGHVVYSSWLDRIVLPACWPLDRVLLPACSRLARMTLGSRALYRLVTGASRLLAPTGSRSQMIVLARRPTQDTPDARLGGGDGAADPG